MPAGLLFPVGLGPVAGPFIKGAAIIASAALIFALVIWYKQHTAAKRRADLAGTAGKLGLRYSAGDTMGCLQLPFGLMRRGEGRGTENLLWGSWQGLDVREFDYWFYVVTSDGKATGRSYSYFTCAVTRLAILGPDLTIAREHLLTHLGPTSIPTTWSSSRRTSTGRSGCAAPTRSSPPISSTPG